MANSSTDGISNQDLSVQIYRYAAIAGIPIFIFGLMINLFILYLFLFDKHFQKISYRLMCVSVISDIISTIASLAGYVQIVRRHLDYVGGTFMCRMVLFLLFASFGVSMMNLCLIGIDRYFIIIRPLSGFYRQYKIYALAFGEVTIWSISIATNGPIFSYVAVHVNDTLLCDIPDITYSVSIYLIAHAVILFVIPTAVILLVYGKIIVFQKSYRRPGEVVKQQRLDDQVKNKRFIKMLTWISTSYILISWPFFATIVGMAVTRQSTLMIRESNIVHFLFSFFTVTITTSIVILNPFIYLKFDLNVRKRSLFQLRRLYPFYRHGRHHRLAPTPSIVNTNGYSTTKF